MDSSRLVNVAQGLVTVALVFDIANYPNLGSKNTLGIVSLATALASFFAARNQGSLIVSGGLVAKGLFDTTLAVQTTITEHSLGALVFGVTIGSLILAFGIAKSLITLRAIRLNGDRGPAGKTLTSTVGMSASRRAK